MVTPGMKWVQAPLATLIFLLISASAQAAFQAFVDRNPVAEGESLTLTLKSDENLDGNPDLDVLQSDFEVLGQSKGSSMQLINGSVTRSLQWQINLIPKRHGQLLIPPIKAGGQATLPLTLIVTHQAQLAPQSGELFIEVSAEPRTAYVGQQIRFTVRLYRTVNLGNNSTLGDPGFPDMDAMVERIGDDRSYQATQNGQTYAVTERHYAVRSQKNGRFSSTPVQFDGEIIEGHQGRGVFMLDPYNQSSRHKRVNSKTLSFAIKAAPAGMGGASWLPASKLELSEQWSENPPKFIAGEPVTRTLQIAANGLSASQLPALESQAVEGLKFYPDQPVLQDNRNDNGVSGVRTQKIALLPLHPGNFTLPAIAVRWWNVNTDRMEVAQLPSRNITVLPGGANSVGANQPPVFPGEIPMGTSAEMKASQKETFGASGSPMHKNDRRGGWPWLSLFLGLGWLATLLLWWWQARKKHPVLKAESSDEGSFRQLENQLKKSCLANDAPEAKSTLLAWAKLRWQNNPPISLTAMAGLCQPVLASALYALDRALYGQAQGIWQGEHLWQLFSQHKPLAAVIQGKQCVSLKPLYPLASAANHASSEMPKSLVQATSSAKPRS